MKEENEINDDLRQLLDSLETHGKNTRRQQQLSDLIDRLAEAEKMVEMPRQRRKLTPLWWAIGTAAACLLLWFVIKPAEQPVETPNAPQLAENPILGDTLSTEVEVVAPIQTPVIQQEPIAETEPKTVAKPTTKAEKPLERAPIEKEEAPLLAEAEEPQPVDFVPLETLQPVFQAQDEPLVAQTQITTRRVIRSEHLVGHDKLEKQPEEKPTKRRVLEGKTLFGQPQDPYMKNGMLAMEIKF